MSNRLIIRHLGVQEYQPIWQAMRDFTHQRRPETEDELWLLEHYPVFTQGQAGKPEHILNPHSIPIIHTDRGGQVTFHGPGQLIAYPLIDLTRQTIDIRSFVEGLEQCVIEVLKHFTIRAESRCEARGVYVSNRKICSIGLRVRRGCTYHGIALNVKLDLTPFSYINPCGFAGLAMTQISDFHPTVTLPQINHLFLAAFLRYFKYTHPRLEEISR